MTSTSAGRRGSVALAAGLGVLVVCVVVSWAYVAHRPGPGVDFVESVWAPARALLHGSDPFDAANVGYLRAYHASKLAPFDAPAMYVLFSPTLVLSAHRAADVMDVLGPGLVWLAILLLVRPRNPRDLAITGIVGAAVILTAAMQVDQMVAQLAPLELLGLALVAATLDQRASQWWPVLGVVVAAVKPQSVVPILIFLALLGAWRVLARSAVVIAVLSLPGLVLFLRAAGGLSACTRVVRANLRFFDHLSLDDLSNKANTRIDLLGVLSHLRGPILSGEVWAAVALAVLTAAVALALHLVDGRRRGLSDPVVLAVGAAYIVLALYHQPYDGLVLFAGAIAALAVLLSTNRLEPAGWVVLAGGGALGVVELLARFPQGSLPGAGPLTIGQTASFTIPGLIAIATVVGACIAHVTRPSGSGADAPPSPRLTAGQGAARS